MFKQLRKVSTVSLKNYKLHSEITLFINKKHCDTCFLNKKTYLCTALAYPIQKKSTGFYQLIEFNAEPSVIAKLEINFRRDERVIRFLTFKMDKYAAEYAAKRRNIKSTKKEEN